MPIHTRACVGTLIGYVYSLGQFLLAGVAYAVPHWRYLQLLVSVPFFAFFIYSWCVGPRGMRGTRLPPGVARRIREGQTNGETEALGGRTCPRVSSSLASPAPPSSPAYLTCSLYPAPKG